MSSTLEINGIKWTKRDDCDYRHNYIGIQKRIDSGELPWWAWRECLMDDAWFFLYFILGPTIGFDRVHHPFLVKACKEIDLGPKTNTLDIWGREHFKTTIISTVKPIQTALDNSERRIGLFSYARPPAIKILQGIKWILEQNEFLKTLFPDQLWADPAREAPIWSLEGGLMLKRRSVARECTFEAWGLLEGMPTGRHFTDRVYDDIETEDSVTNPEQMEKLERMFFLSANLGTDGGTCRVTGTPYHYNALLMRLKNLKDPVTGESQYHLREKPSVEPREFNGKPVFLSEARIRELRIDRRSFSAQHLLDPSPVDIQTLNPEYLIEVRHDQIPKNLYKFMVIDPAGSSLGDDAWAMLLLGIEPFRDDIGASDLFILDALIEPLAHDDAVKNIVDMYLRGGRVLKLGVEKVGISTTEIHVAKALRAKGKIVTLKSGSLEVLRPAGRSKQQRIESALVWPLNNGKLHISKAVPAAYRDRIRFEMEKFPYWHDDALDALSYGYDLIKDYTFPKHEVEKEEVDPWEEAFRRAEEKKQDRYLYV